MEQEAHSVWVKTILIYPSPDKMREFVILFFTLYSQYPMREYWMDLPLKPVNQLTVYVASLAMQFNKVKRDEHAPHAGHDGKQFIQVM